LNLTEVIGVLSTKAKVTSSDLAVMLLVQTTPKQEQITKKINQQADKENNILKLSLDGQDLLA
jgi:hypothetical protein